jgi:lipid-A-disaccharide synthase
MSHIPLVFIIAGEPSGDQLGADLMTSLKELKDVRFTGVGGPAMTAQGLTSIFPMEELSLMGVLGILKNLPNLLHRLSYTIETIRQMKPDVVITIDAQEFSFRVMKRLHKLSERPRLIHYVAPTVWAWRPGRARKISAVVDRLLCLYPFEPPYFEKFGLKTTFVGHPIAKKNDKTVGSLSNRVIPAQTGIQNNQMPLNKFSMDSRLRGNDIGEVDKETSSDIENRNPNLLCVLPGSRRSEIQTLLPIFGQTAALLRKEVPSLKIIIPTLPSMKELVEQGIQAWSLDVQIVVGDEARQLAFQKAYVALAASGTVALQLSEVGLPFIIAYKVDKINEWIGRAILKTPWACMVNILLAFHTFGPEFVLNRKAKKKIKESWIPEFLQDDCTPQKLTEALIKLLEDSKARNRQEQAMREAIHLLTSSQTAAKSVLEEINTSLHLRKISSRL